MIGMTAAFTAGLAAALADGPSGDLDGAIRRAMTAARRLAEVGFRDAPDGAPHYPHAQASGAAGQEDRAARFADVILKGEEEWSILHDTLGDVDLLARRVVVEGPDVALSMVRSRASASCAPPTAARSRVITRSTTCCANISRCRAASRSRSRCSARRVRASPDGVGSRSPRRWPSRAPRIASSSTARSTCRSSLRSPSWPRPSTGSATSARGAMSPAGLLQRFV